MISNMTPKDRIAAFIKLEGVDRIPVIDGTTTAALGKEMMGVSVKDFCVEMGDLAFRVIKTTYDAIGWDNVEMGQSCSLEAEALGSVLKYPNDTYPMLIKPAAPEPEDVDRLRVPDPLKDGKFPLMLKTVELLAEEYGRRNVPVAAWVNGVGNMLMQVRGVENSLADLKIRPDVSRKLLNIVGKTAVEWGKALINSGAEMIDQSEVMGVKEFLSADFVKGFLFSWWHWPLREWKRQGAYVYTHDCGLGCPDIRILPLLDADFHWPSNLANLGKYKAVLGMMNHKAIAGNLDPAGALLRGTPEDVINDARRAIREGTTLEQPEGFALMPGCSVAIDTPLENCRAMMRAAETHGKYPLKILRALR
jgi:uroporphyrinogen decarboxylase